MGGQTGSQEQQTQSDDAAAAVDQRSRATELRVRAKRRWPSLAAIPGADDAGHVAAAAAKWNTAASYGQCGPAPVQRRHGWLHAGALGQTPMNVTAGQLSNTNLDPYMNPYTQERDQFVAADHAAGARQDARRERRHARSRQGAFGGSRFGVQQGTAQAQGALGMANMAAGLNSQNFAQAQAAATGDINRTLTADQSNQHGAASEDQFRHLGGEGLNTTGDSMHGIRRTEAYAHAEHGRHAADGAGSERHQRADGEVPGRLELSDQAAWHSAVSARHDALRADDRPARSNTETYTPMDWARSPARAWACWARSSPARVGQAAEEEPEEGWRRIRKSDMPIYDYNWKGEQPGAPKTRGPMAQDVAKKFPAAVAEIRRRTLARFIRRCLARCRSLRRRARSARWR